MISRQPSERIQKSYWGLLAQKGGCGMTYHGEGRTVALHNLSDVSGEPSRPRDLFEFCHPLDRPIKATSSIGRRERGNIPSVIVLSFLVLSPESRAKVVLNHT